MFLVTGLGNPGKEYEDTPHNAGFLFLDTLKKRVESMPSYQVDEWEDESKLFNSLICKVRKGGEVVGLLQKPTTYMNLSGQAVRSIMEKFDIESFVLVHDDLDIKLGEVKVQLGKSPRGHKGVLSVETSLNSTDFLRVRIGIENRVNMNIPGEDYVLRKYTSQEKDILMTSIEESVTDILLDLNIQ